MRACKYEALDEAIIGTIQKGRCSFNYILGEVKASAMLVAPKDQVGQTHSWRLVDRRLQALRKAGRITYSRGYGWSVL